MRVATIVLILIFTGCAEAIKEWSVGEEGALIDLYIDIQTAQVIMDRTGTSDLDSIEDVLWQKIETIHGQDREDLEELIVEASKQPEFMKRVLQSAEKRMDSLKTNVAKEINK